MAAMTMATASNAINTYLFAANQDSDGAAEFENKVECSESGRSTEEA
jgi:hypothetical protein